MTCARASQVHPQDGALDSVLHGLGGEFEHEHGTPWVMSPRI